MPDATTESALPPPRAPYDPPVLRVFGSLADLTAAIGGSAAIDGGKGTKKRSAP